MFSHLIRGILFWTIQQVIIFILVHSNSNHFNSTTFVSFFTIHFILFGSYSIAKLRLLVFNAVSTSAFIIVSDDYAIILRTTLWFSIAIAAIRVISNTIIPRSIYRCINPVNNKYLDNLAQWVFNTQVENKRCNYDWEVVSHVQHDCIDVGQEYWFVHREKQNEANQGTDQTCYEG